MAKQVLAIGDTGTDLVNKFNNNADELYDGTEVTAMVSADQPDGTELLGGLQGGAPRSFTTEQIAGDGAAQEKGLAKDKRRFFTSFTAHPVFYTQNTDGPLEHGVHYLQGGEGNVKYDSTANLAQGITLQTQLEAGSSGFSGNFSGVILGMGPNTLTAAGLAAGGDVDVRMTVYVNKPWTASGSYSESFFGILTQPADAAPTKGYYFSAEQEVTETGAANNFWRYTFNNGTDTPVTGITAIDIPDPALGFISQGHIFRIHFDHAAQTTTYYINGTPVAVIDNSVSGDFLFGDPDTTPLYYGGYIRKTANTNQAAMILSSLRAEDSIGFALVAGADVSDI